MEPAIMSNMMKTGNKAAPMEPDQIQGENYPSEKAPEDGKPNNKNISYKDGP
jgi:hypothetical protein